MAKEQAENDQHVAAEEKATRKWQEQLVDLAQVNCKVSPVFFFLLQNSVLDLTIPGQAHARGQVEPEAGLSRPKNKVSTMLMGIGFWY